MAASLQRVCARLWFVLKLALGPAKGAARTWGSWWPTALTVLAAVGGVLGFSVPKHPNPGWVLAGVLAVIALLFLRAAYKLHAERDRPFPDVEISAGTVSHTHPGDVFHLLSISTRLTNREDASVSLSFLLFCQYGRDSGDRFLAPPIPRSTSFLPIPKDVKSLQTPPKPLDVVGKSSDGGHLVFMWYTDWAKTFGEKPVALFLEVTEHISGKKIELSVPGHYSKAS